MRRILKFTLIPLLVLLCTAFPINAEAATSGTCGDNAKWYVSGKTLVIYGSGDMYDYEADDSPWNDHISSGTASGGANITSIQIGNQITSIGDYAFWNNMGITSIKIGSGVQRIGKSSCNFDALEELELPEGLTVIEDSAFAFCYDLKEVNLPSSLQYLGYYSFGSCKSLTTIHIPAGITDFIIDGTFYDNHPFYGCTGLKSFTVDPNSSILTAKDGVLFNKNMTRLIQYPIAAANTAYSIPDTVTTIGYGAFSKVQSLKSITVPASVKEIHEYAFSFCPKLNEITFQGDFPKLEASYIFEDSNLTAYHPIGNTTWTASAKQNYGGAVTWETKSPDGGPAGTQGDNAFWMIDEDDEKLIIWGSGALKKEYTGHDMPWYSYYDKFTSIEVKDGITEIPSYAFEFLEDVETISLPNTLTKLAMNAFNDCGSLNNLLIPESLQTITGSSNTGYPAFIRCESLTDVYYLGTEAEWLSIPNAQYVDNHDAEMTMHFLVLHENPATCTESGTQSYYTFDDTSVYSGMYDLEKNIITELSVLPALNHAGETGAVCSKCGANLAGDMGVGGICGDNLTWSFTEGTGTLTISGVGPMNDFEYQNVPWSDHRSEIYYTVVEEGVTSIGSFAFWGCSKLLTIQTPQTLTNIGEGAFMHCGMLTGSPILPKEMTVIPEGIYYNCSSLTGTVQIPENVTEIKDGAFYCCSGLSGVLTIPQKVTKIERIAFYQCNKLTGLELTEGLCSIGANAFEGCHGLDGELILPNSLTEMGSEAFGSCSNIDSVVLGKGLQTLPGYAFFRCGSLRKIDLGNIERIGSYAIASCGLTGKLTFPASLTSIASNNNLGGGITELVFLSPKVPEISTSMTSMTSLAIVWVPAESLEAYTLALAVRLPENTEIRVNAGGQCGENVFWSFEEGNGMLTISGSGEMYDYTIASGGSTAPWTSYKEEITTILINEGVTSIGSFSFVLCENLKDISLPESLLCIEEAAFYQCYALTQLSLPNGLQEIGHNAFHSNNLNSVQLGTAVQTIGKNPFYNNKNLQIITVAEGNTWYYTEDNVLFCKKTLELICYPSGLSQPSYTVPAGIISIGENGFAGNNHINSVELADSVISLKSGAFAGCSSLSKLDFPSNLQTIENVALSDTALEQIFIPASIKTIGSSALPPKTLKSIIFEGDAPSFSASTFGVTAYDSITATAYYPAGNATWTDEVRQNYGGTITWEAYCTSHSYSNPEFAWKEYDACTAIFTCGYCGDIQNLTCEISVQTKPATSGQEGKKIYTAIVRFFGETYTDIQEETVPKQEHVHGFGEKLCSDSTAHWKECLTCGEKVEITTHTPGAEATENTSQKCTICGYVLRTPLGLDWFFDHLENPDNYLWASEYYAKIMEQYD